MSVEFVPAALARALTTRIDAARGTATQTALSPAAESAEYWEAIFEAHAAAVLATLDGVRLSPGYVVRYRFYGQKGSDLLVRPFVARATTDVTMIRSFIDWHPAPDSLAALQRGQPSRDAELLYRHFHFAPSAAGYFEYWLAMQELWASARWVHSRLVADAEEFHRLTDRDNWQVQHAVERFEPAVVIDDAGGAQLAVLIYCPLERESVVLHHIRIGPEHDVQLVDTIPVASGPRGYIMQ